MSNATEANFSFTTKIDGDLFTIRGNSIQEFQQNLEAANQSGIGANIKAMVTSVNNTGALNSVLGATPVDPAQNSAPVHQEQQQPQQQGNPWEQQGQQPQGQWGQPQQQAPQQQGGWGAPPQQQGGWGNAPQGGGGAPAGMTPPTNPITGQPMMFKEGVSKKTGKPYKMWVDERPWSQIKDLPDHMKAQSQFIR